MSETEFGCVLAGAAALGAVLVMTSRSNPHVMAPRRAHVRQRDARDDHAPEPMLAAGGPILRPGLRPGQIFDAPTLFPEPTLQTKNVNAIAGRRPRGAR